MNEFKVGDRAVAKVGRNEINVEILAVEGKSYLVRNNILLQKYDTTFSQ